jgi:hypothetical protein
MRRCRVPAGQLSLWGNELPEQKQAPCPEPLVVVKELDTKAMQEWLFDWGKRHNFPGFGFPFDLAASRRNYQYETDDRRWGRMFRGEVGWIESLIPPHCGQRERYPGEWLQKAMEQCQRFDAGVSIPPQVSEQSGDDE